MKLLQNKTVLVSGASSGLGLRCAELAAEDGARLVLLSRKPGELRVRFPEPHAAIACDVSQEESVQGAVRELKTLAVSLDGVVLAAGIQDVRPLLMESRKSLENAWATNVYGTIGLLAQLLKARVIAKGASVVLFSSAAASAGGAGIVSYASTKGAIEAATHSLAMELAPQRIRVNAVAPGVARTPMSEKYLGRMTADQTASLEAGHPLGLGTPDCVARPVVFLLSDDAQWMTGSIVRIDGGLTSH